MKSNAFAADVLKSFYQAVAVPNLVDNAASAPLTNLYLSLHTADPGVAGSQSTNEAAYTSYARVAVARSTGGFTLSGQTISLAALTSFPAATGGSETETHFAIGTAGTGAGTILHSGPIGTNQGAFTGLSSTSTMTIPNLSGVSVGDRMSFYATPGGTLPGGVSQGVVYYVITVSGTQVTISTTSGGGTLTFTSNGDGLAFRHAPLSVVSGTTPQLTTGTSIVEA